MEKIEVIVLKGFRKAAAKILTQIELDSLIDFLAENPEIGPIIQGSRGLRKMRWAYGNKGKSGGARAIYYFRKSESEVLLLTIYAKNAKSDLEKYEIKALSQFVFDIIEEGSYDDKN